MNIIPPNVTVDFFNGILDNILKNEKKVVLKLLKLIKWSVIKRINVFFEREVLSSKIIDIITFSNNVKSNLLMNNTSHYINHIEVINPGIDERYFFRLNENSIIKYRQKFGINKDDFVVLYVGRLSLGKNINILIDAFNLLKIKNKKLLLIGEGDVKINQNNNIIELGKKTIEDLHIYYSISNVLVLPTFNEGFGQVLTESLGCGTPIVGFDTPNNAIDEIITEKKLTCYGLSNAILEVYNDKNFYFSNSKEIEVSTKEKFSWDKIINRVLK